MSRSQAFTVALLSLVFLVSPSRAASLLPECDDRPSPETLVQEIEITSLDPQGADRMQAGTLHWKLTDGGHSKALLSIERPLDMRGAKYLLLEQEGRDDMFVYLPAIQKIRRITGRTVSGSLFGTDFSYEDVEYLKGTANVTGGERLADSELEGRPVYVVQASPDAGSESAYERIVSFIDRANCVPLRVEFYVSGDSASKILTVDPSSIEEHGDFTIPLELRMRDLERETESRMVVKKVELNAEVPDRYFTQSYLGRGH